MRRKRHRVERRVSTSRATQRTRSPRTVLQYEALPEKSRDSIERTLKVIANMRAESKSLRTAAHELRVSPRTVVRWSGKALTKRANGRYVPKRTDKLFRLMKVLTPDGVKVIGIRGSRVASELAEHANAAERYLTTGDSSRLGLFIDKKITDADGNEIPLLTDLATLDRLGSAGVLSFESLY